MVFLKDGTNGCSVIQSTAITNIFGARENIHAVKEPHSQGVLSLFRMKLLETNEHGFDRGHISP